MSLKTDGHEPRSLSIFQPQLGGGHVGRAGCSDSCARGEALCCTVADIWQSCGSKMERDLGSCPSVWRNLAPFYVHYSGRWTHDVVSVVGLKVGI